MSAFYVMCVQPPRRTTHRLGLDLAATLMQAGVHASKRADVLLIIPRDLLGIATLRRGGDEKIPQRKNITGPTSFEQTAAQFCVASNRVNKVIRYCRQRGGRDGGYSQKTSSRAACIKVH